MEIHELVQGLREYKGVVRKSAISNVALALLPSVHGDVVATHGEDAAVIKCGRDLLLLAADGIREDLVSRNPYWAGYCAVLVNVNDIAAMGGIPVAMVNVLSCADEKMREDLVRGMKDASEKFGVPMVGGHLHPDSTYAAVDVAILGKTERSRLVLSNGASEGDSVVFAMDLDGSYTDGAPYSWDTTSRKSRERVRRQIKVMNRIAPYLTAGKDISNPGALGTLGMLLEASGKGAYVDVSKMPRPKGVPLLQWLTSYQGCGFVVTCREGREERVIGEFSRVGIDASHCGKVTPGKLLEIEHHGGKEVLFDFSRDTLGCAVPQKL
ncbi:MAG TPA: AIR synthase related protein [Thermoplasmata archaeon]